MVGPHSVLILDEKEHLATRKMLLPPFHGERMRVYGDVMRELAEAEVERWPVGEPFPVLPSMQRLTLRIILRTVFGLEEGARDGRARGRDRPHAPAGHADHARAAAAARPRARYSPAGQFAAASAEVDRLLLAELAAAPRERRPRRRRALDAAGARCRTRPTTSCATTW